MECKHKIQLSLEVAEFKMAQMLKIVGLREAADPGRLLGP